MIIVQISDPHIDYSDPLSQQRLHTTLQHIQQMPTKADLLLITGDCTEHGHPDEYHIFQQLIQQTPIPTYYIPGNHDDRKTLIETLGVPGHNQYKDYIQYTIENHGPVRIIALDTLIQGSRSGSLNAQQLTWLDQQLAAQPQRPTMLMMHHPPLTTGLMVLDSMGLDCQTELAQVIQKYNNIVLIAAGHFHGHYQQRFANTTTIICPSTNHQWIPDFLQPDRFVVQYQTPTCLVHIWNDQFGLLSYPNQISEHGPYRMLHDGVDWIPQTE